MNLSNVVQDDRYMKYSSRLWWVDISWWYQSGSKIDSLQEQWCSVLKSVVECQRDIFMTEAAAPESY